MPDPVLALVDYLKADTTVSDLVGTNVFDFEIDETFDNTMPTKAVMIRPHGGPKDWAPLELNTSRVQVLSFGETPHLSYSVYWAVHLALKALVSSVWHHTYIHSVIQQSGPVFGREADPLQWPYQMALYQVLASDLDV